MQIRCAKLMMQFMMQSNVAK